jgi:hypothetical protein
MAGARSVDSVDPAPQQNHTPTQRLMPRPPPPDEFFGLMPRKLIKGGIEYLLGKAGN